MLWYVYLHLRVSVCNENMHLWSRQCKNNKVNIGSSSARQLEYHMKKNANANQVMVHFRMTYNNAELKHQMSQYIVAQNCGRTLHIHVIDHLFFQEFTTNRQLLFTERGPHLKVDIAPHDTA